MSSRKQALLQRRAQLQAKIATQRAELAELSQRWQPAFALADQVVAAAGFVRRHALPLAALTGLFLLRRNGAVALVKGGWKIWKAYRYVRRIAEGGKG